MGLLDARVGFAAALLVSGAARAGSAEAIHLSYEAPAECPSRDAFDQQIRSRFDRLRSAEPQERARTFIAEVTRQEAGFEGVLTVRDTDGQESTRSFSALRCDEVVSALALVAAAAIELRAARTPIEPRADAPPEPVKPPAPVKPPEPVKPSDAAAVAPPPPAARLGWSLAAGAHFGVTGGAAPEPLLGGAAFVDVEHARASAWSPLFRAGVRFSPGGRVPASEAFARFSLVAAQLEACPAAVRAGSRVTVRPCVRLEAGLLSASGLEMPDPRAESRPWVSPSAVGRVQVRAWSSVSLELEAALGFPLLRYRYYFGRAGDPANTTTVHQVPAVTASGGAGVSVAIW